MNLWHRPLRRALSFWIGAALAGWLIGSAGQAAADTPAAPRIVARGVVPDTAAVRRQPHDPTATVAATTRLGGFSDLCHAAPRPRDDARSAGNGPSAVLDLWTITDRGPNGFVKTPAGKRRTLVEPDFVPSLVRLAVTLPPDGPAAIGPPEAGREGAAAAPAPLGIEVAEVLPLAGRSGRLLSGRANGLGNDPDLLDPTGADVIPPDPDGVDTEGVVHMADGSFWIVEEYRPSLLQVTAAGRAQARFVPAAADLPGAAGLHGADMEVGCVLPARLAQRQDNRGFEAVCAAPDQARLFCLLQSPLRGEEHPDERGGHVPLVVFDPVARQALAEHAYPLDADTIDGKLCAMAAIDAETLLVLEQGKGGRAMLHAVRLPAAEATRPAAEDRPAGGGRLAVQKRLVADLGPLLPGMRHDVFGGVEPQGEGLKLEGLAIVGERRIAIVNDNDFGVTDGRARSCLWIVELPERVGPPEADGS